MESPRHGDHSATRNPMPAPPQFPLIELGVGRGIGHLLGWIESPSTPQVLLTKPVRVRPIEVPERRVGVIAVPGISYTEPAFCFPELVATAVGHERMIGTVACSILATAFRVCESEQPAILESGEEFWRLAVRGHDPLQPSQLWYVRLPPGTTWHERYAWLQNYRDRKIGEYSRRTLSQANDLVDHAKKKSQRLIPQPAKTVAVAVGDPDYRSIIALACADLGAHMTTVTAEGTPKQTAALIRALAPDLFITDQDNAEAAAKLHQTVPSVIVTGPDMDEPTYKRVPAINWTDLFRIKDYVQQPPR